MGRTKSKDLPAAKNSLQQKKLLWMGVITSFHPKQPKGIISIAR